MRDHIRTFDLFNSANTGATVDVQDGHLYFEQGEISGGLSSLGNDIGVTINQGDDASQYDVQATTEELHPLIGKRRFGANFGRKELGCDTVVIWTEAYEVTNNFNWVAKPLADSLANTMWKNYLDAISGKIHCGGLKTRAVKVIDEDLPNQLIPW